MFKKVLVIYNPHAGRGKGIKHAERIKKILEKNNVNVSIFKSQSIELMQKFFKELKEEFDCFIIIGGDGTLGPVVDGMLKANKNVPIYAFGKGTANDFASYFKTTTKSIKKFAKIFLNAFTTETDVLEVNGQYAVSVACGGAFTNGVTKYNKRSKKLFGKLAYFGKAFFTAMRMKSHEVEFIADGITYNEKVFLFLIANTKYAGGLKFVGSLATHNDGIFDLVVIKKCGFFGKLSVFLSLIRKKIDKDKHVLYIKGKHFIIKPAKPAIHNFTISDIDGNAGPQYPIEVKVSEKKITVVSKDKF